MLDDKKPRMEGCVHFWSRLLGVMKKGSPEYAIAMKGPPITEVRRIVQTADQERVYAELGILVEDGLVIYPTEVLEELKRYTGFTKNKPDLPCEWAKKHQKQATRFGFDNENLKRVLANPQVSRVVDSERTRGEEADPYILELGTRLRDAGHEIVILTEDKKDKPAKLSLHSAAGLLRLVPLGIDPFLEQRGIWKK